MELDPNFRTTWPIQQGDAFGFWDWRTRQPLNRFGLIITADCDIENGHPDQELVYLRIVSQSDYVDIFWSRAKLLIARRNALRDLVPQLNKFRTEFLPEVEPLGESDVLSWVISSTSNEIAEAVRVTDEKRDKLIKNVEKTRSAASLADAPIGSSCLERLLQLRRQERSVALSQAANDLRSNRDELFFITSLTEPEDTSGYYVLLDQIGTVRRDQIGDSMEAVKTGQKSAYRFGSLFPAYKYAVAQRFAFLFQKIGLPNEHNDRRDASLARLSSSQISPLDG